MNSDFEAVFEPQPDDYFTQLILEGLANPQKSLPALFLYDERGSELFEDITQLKEYYPTRTEISLLERYANDMASSIAPGATIVEFGSGSSKKTPLLLNALEFPKTYVPVDISKEFLLASAKNLATELPHINIMPVVGDFTQSFDMPEKAKSSCHVGFFPGSTIGNFTPDEAINFLKNARQSLGEGSLFILGVDLIKGEDILVPAYDDDQGVTAQFNLNVLSHLNEAYGGTFDLSKFQHIALFNKEHNRIEMHLKALEDLKFEVAGSSFQLQKGETIHTENSYKYSIEGVKQLAHESGWHLLVSWTDERDLFSLHMMMAK